MNLNSEFQLQVPIEFEILSILFTVSTGSRIYVLYSNSILSEFEFSGTMNGSVELENSMQIPSILYADDLYVYVGYENGTTEVRDQFTNLTYLKTTSIKDPGGPGNPKITDISASEDFLLVNTLENGLLIYIKPSILFYKWIMIELETSIKSFTINKHLLFVLTVHNEIHLLNFNKQRLDELPVGGFEYTDIEFDGKYLYVGSKNSLNVYDYHNDSQLTFSHKFTQQKLLLLIKIKNQLMIVFTDSSVTILMIDISDSKTKFSFQSTDKWGFTLPIQAFKILKTYFKGPLPTNLINKKFLWTEDNKVFQTNLAF